MNVNLPKKKIFILASIILIYLIFALAIILLVESSVITKMPPLAIAKVSESADEAATGILSLLNESPVRINLKSAELFVNNELNNNYHINLYYGLGNKTIDESNFTNSEAASYYLFWNAQDRNKQAFDAELDFIEKNMIEPNEGYMMWKLDSSNNALDNNRNIATDADLRTIKALLLAKSRWPDKRYDKAIKKLSESLEKIAITSDGLLAPYGGVRNGNLWKTQEVWLSYSDFDVFRQLSYIRGYPWINVYNNMKKAILKSQIPSGLYNTQLDENKNYHNTLDNGDYSVNSLWAMVRSAESGDKELMNSAALALNLYKKSFEDYGAVYLSYDSAGKPVLKYESPWVYALVARTSIALDDKEFSDKMINKLINMQSTNNDSYGAFIEGSANGDFAGQFTMQESIITMQAYLAKYEFS